MKLLGLLQSGCRVTWPDGYWLAGTVRSDYIELGHGNTGLGLWNSCRGGLADALDKMSRMRALTDAKGEATQ